MDERGAPRRIAILGDAAGTVARAYGHYFPTTRVDAVELDGELTTIGKRYFDLRGPDLHLYTADARPWLEQSTAAYDDIFLDAYRQPYIPFYLVTREFFDLVRAHLRPGGAVIVNVGPCPRLRFAGAGRDRNVARGLSGCDARSGQQGQFAADRQRSAAFARSHAGRDSCLCAAAASARPGCV